MKFKHARTIVFHIHIAGDYDIAKEICRRYCGSGFCVSLWKTDYIYKLGEESGVTVKVINYPRFPTNFIDLLAATQELGYKLMHGLHQGSFTIEHAEDTLFYSIRPEDQEE